MTNISADRVTSPTSPTSRGDRALVNSRMALAKPPCVMRVPMVGPPFVETRFLLLRGSRDHARQAPRKGTKGGNVCGPDFPRVFLLPAVYQASRAKGRALPATHSDISF